MAGHFGSKMTFQAFMVPAFAVSFRLFHDENRGELVSAPFFLATEIAFHPRAHGHMGVQEFLPANCSPHTSSLLVALRGG